MGRSAISYKKKKNLHFGLPNFATPVLRSGMPLKLLSL
jgi:hypothetical protein